MANYSILRSFSTVSSSICYSYLEDGEDYRFNVKQADNNGK